MHPVHRRRSQPRNTQEAEEDVELRMPGSFDFAFADQGGGAAHETPGAGTVHPPDAVLGNLCRRMQVRWRCGQGQPALRISLHLDLRFVSTLTNTVTIRSAFPVLFGSFEVVFVPLLGSGFDCIVHVARCSPCICGQWESYRKAT
jgi:hypothetical protein